MTIAVSPIAMALAENSFTNSAGIAYVSTSSISNNSTSTASPMMHSDIDSTPIAAVITISKGPQGDTVFNPQTTTIKTGEEILILNNDGTRHTLTNGMGSDDPLAGKLFDTGSIHSKKWRVLFTLLAGNNLS